jgi:F0F1-type ATP synthase membrane subunit b/b'
MSDQDQSPMTPLASIAPSVQELETSYNLLNNLNLVLLIGAGIIALAIALVSVWSTRKGNELIRAKDAQLKSDLKDKDLQIEKVKSDAQRDVENARNEAKERLEIETKRVEGEAGRKIEEAKTEAGLKIEQARAEAAREVGRVQIAVAQQQERAAIAERELAEVKRLQLPRSIPLNMRDRLIEKLKPFAGQALLVAEPVSSDQEASQFAQQIETLVTAAGWKYQVVMRAGTVVSVGNERIPQPHGLICAVADLANLPLAAIVLTETLREAGAQIRIAKELDFTDPKVVGLVVGLKPIQ